MASHKELKYQYKQARKDMGVYQIRNEKNGKFLIASSANINAVLNKNRFVLKYGSHKDRELQREWNEFGESCFTIEVLELVDQKDEEKSDYSSELALLEKKWSSKLSHRPDLYE